MLPNNGNGICCVLSSTTHCSTALPARAMQGGSGFVFMQARGECWGQPILLWPYQFVHSPCLEQPELQVKMFLQGSAAEQQLEARSRTSHQRSWRELQDITTTTIHMAQPPRQLTLAMGEGWTWCPHSAGWTQCPHSAGWEQSHEGLMLPQPPARRAGKETTRCSETNFTA